MKKMLNEIYYEQKATNRQLQRLSNIALMGILTWLARSAIDRDDEQGKKICITGLILAIVAESVLLVSGILDYRNKSIGNHDSKEDRGMRKWQN